MRIRLRSVSKSFKFSNFSTVGLWNSTIREAVNHGHSHKALFLFRQMKQNGFEPDNFTFPFIAKACAKLANLRFSQVIHTHAIKSLVMFDVFVQTALVDMYVKCDQLEDAHDLFEGMPVRDVAAWNSMIIGFAHSSFPDKVFSLFRQMRIAGIQPDSITVMGLTQATISQSKNVEFLKAIHSLGIRIGLEADTSVANTWISAYARCSNLDLAKVIFEGIDLATRTVVSWNSIIAAHSSFEKYLDALNCYKRMLVDRYRPDSGTIVGLLSSCAQPEALLEGTLVHSHAIQLGCNSDISVVNTLISMYSKCGDILFARLLFDSISCGTCVTWNVMISGYAEKGDLHKALELFGTMEAAGVKPDLVTIISLISGCGKTGSLEFGRRINHYAFSNGLRDNIIVCNALIDMYAKSGSINDAYELFYAMPEKTVVSWTTMISGCALNGEMKEALDLFNKMLESGFKPNHITFLAVLQACTHAGLLEKGMEYFDTMINVCNINPGLDHYSCVVDLLGRKGKIKEALELVQNMPMKPDAGIWSSLLSACKIHRNIEIAEHVSRHLFELDPLVAVPYVEMANIFASGGNWDGVASIRKMMKCNKVKKSVGKSIVQVNGKAHAFAVEDRGHPEGLYIYEIVDSLMLQLKEQHSKISDLMLEHELTPQNCES